MTKRKRVAVLISGRGSNLQALIEAAAHPDYPAEIALVLSNVAGAPGIERAAEAGIPSRTVPHRAFASREEFDTALDQVLRQNAIEFVCLAGFMRILSDFFARAWQGRLINIHPSLLPAFKGIDVHKRVLEAGVRISGCTVHFVVPELDSGPIIAQAAVPVLTDDTEETLSRRILAAEHRLYPHALKLLAANKVRMSENAVTFDFEPGDGGQLFSPPLAYS
jgi:phosphoribosylglycinamide formyltransferase-1